MRIGTAFDQACRFFDSVGETTIWNWNTEQLTTRLVIFDHPKAKRRRVHSARQKGLIAQGIYVRYRKSLLS